MSCSVYVIGPQDGLYKIGISRDPQLRLSEIKRVQGPMPSIHALYERNSDGEARSIERAAHHTLRPLRVWGEWFSVTPDQAMKAIEKAIISSDRGDYANDKSTWGVKNMPVRIIKKIRREAQIEGVTIAEWLERRVLDWEERDRPRLAAPPKAPEAPE
jgi:hypothetical protein